MGLPGQHIVETGLARLASLWPASRSHMSLPDFLPTGVISDPDDSGPCQCHLQRHRST